MPLEKGSSKAVISRNIKEMKESGHSQEQSVAVALHTAHPEGSRDEESMPPRHNEEPSHYERSMSRKTGASVGQLRKEQAAAERANKPKDGDGEEGTLNSHMKESAKKAGAIISHDEYAKPVTAMSHSEINKKNEEYWGNLGPAPSGGATNTRNAPVPVYKGAGVGDEVEPTQSNPPDSRSNNTLTREGGGIPGTEPLATDGAELKRYPKAAPVGERNDIAKELKNTPKPTRKNIHKSGLKEIARMQDDLVEGSEAMEVKQHQ